MVTMVRMCGRRRAQPRTFLQAIDDFAIFHVDFQCSSRI